MPTPQRLFQRLPTHAGVSLREVDRVWRSSVAFVRAMGYRTTDGHTISQEWKSTPRSSSGFMTASWSITRFRISRELLVSPAELSGLHTVLQDADAGLGLIKAGVGDFVEEHDVLEANAAQVSTISFHSPSDFFHSTVSHHLLDIEFPSSAMIGCRLPVRRTQTGRDPARLNPVAYGFRLSGSIYRNVRSDLLSSHQHRPHKIPVQPVI